MLPRILLISPLSNAQSVVLRTFPAEASSSTTTATPSSSDALQMATRSWAPGVEMILSNSAPYLLTPNAKALSTRWRVSLTFVIACSVQSKRQT
jgi:hypothetical protein